VGPGLEAEAEVIGTAIARVLTMAALAIETTRRQRLDLGRVSIRGFLT